ARLHVQFSRWKEAMADFTRAMETAGGNEDGYEYAALKLILEDTEGYRKFTTKWIEKSGKTKDPFLAYVLARTCTLVPKSLAEPERMVAWAEQAVKSKEDVASDPHALGPADYRAGKYDLALQRLEESEKNRWDAHVLNWIVRAMAYQKKGQSEKALQLLDKAVEHLDKIAPTETRPTSLAPTDWVEA